MNRVGVRAAEHLKGWVSEVLDQYQEGSFNRVEASLLIWDEIQSTLSAIKPKHFQNVLWMRIAVSAESFEASRIMFEILAKGEILSSRYLGPRGDITEGVFYVAVLTANIHEAVEIVDNLVNEGYSVRDWSFGANRR